MNPKEIGRFLKELRNEKGITQEQLAEMLGVSGRTVSRWETGTNLPDLSILVQISEFYDVEIKEILSGKRKNGNMNEELKETLLKVADYHELEKQRAAKVGNHSFFIMFLTCAMMIVVQMLMTGNLSLVIGETVILVIGGLVYICFIVLGGAWNASMYESTPKKDLAVSIVCAGIFSIIFYMMLIEKMNFTYAIGGAICFFVFISAAGFAILRVLSCISEKRSHKQDN